jgi:hypothetical protein
MICLPRPAERLRESREHHEVGLWGIGYFAKPS